MKWQSFGHDFMDRGMNAEISRPLEELYRMQSEAEARLAELRASEPLPKRKNARQRVAWFALCQDEITRLQNIRDAIIEAKKGLGG